MCFFIIFFFFPSNFVDRCKRAPLSPFPLLSRAFGYPQLCNQNVRRYLPPCEAAAGVNNFSRERAPA